MDNNLINLFKNKTSNEKSLLIDKYLIPQELEKKTNAEVSTPFSLRKEISNNLSFLDKLKMYIKLKLEK